MFSSEMGISRKKQPRGWSAWLGLKRSWKPIPPNGSGCLDTSGPICKLFKNISSKFYR